MAVPGSSASQFVPPHPDWWREVLAASPDGVAVVAADGRILYLNEALASLSGWSRADLVGAGVEVLVPAERRARHERLRQEYAVRPAPRAMGEVRRLGLLRRDGVEVPVEIALAPLPGVPRLVVATVRDVSVRRAAETAARRQAVAAECVADVARAALERRPEGVVLERLATGVLDALEAETAAVLLGADHRVGRASGVAVGRLAAALAPALEPGPGAALRARLVPSEAVALARPPAGLPPDLAGAVGPMAAAPFGGDRSRPSGGLVAMRPPGAPAFRDDDVDRLARLATQTQVALNLARARADQQRLVLLEERQRIARELHDTVIQDVIAVGMQIAADVDAEPDPRRQERDLERVASLEAAVRNLRRAVFELRPSTRRASTAAALADVVGEAVRMLGHHPTVTLSGPVDELPEDVADDVVAALREALANVARHAGARSSAVAVTVTSDRVTLTVDDDGSGPPPEPRAGYGLGYVESAALRHGGRLALTPGPRTGTRLTWSSPLPAARDAARGPGT